MVIEVDNEEAASLTTDLESNCTESVASDDSMKLGFIPFDI